MELLVASSGRDARWSLRIPGDESESLAGRRAALDVRARPGRARAARGFRRGGPACAAGGGRHLRGRCTHGRVGWPGGGWQTAGGGGVLRPAQVRRQSVERQDRPHALNAGAQIMGAGSRKSWGRARSSRLWTMTTVPSLGSVASRFDRDCGRARDLVSGEAVVPLTDSLRELSSPTDMGET